MLNNHPVSILMPPPFGDQYYPCKILAFLSIPNKLDSTKPNRVAAVVQPCETRLSIDVSADTRLLQVWTLEYDKIVNVTASNPLIKVDGKRRHSFIGGYREPLVREVDVNSFDKRVLVIEKNPGNHKHLQCKRNSNATVCSRRVFLVKDRDKSWAGHYLNWNSDQTREYKFVKKKADRKSKPQNKR